MNNPRESLRHLNSSNKPAYHLISTPGEIPTRFSFDGLLLDRPTTWETTLWTTSDYPEPSPCPEGQSQFMHIGDTEAGITPITIVLNLPEIDEGAMLKTLIMIRKYKRLRPGLICFGS